MRTILITGASSGIGRALALERTALGDRVWATLRSKADADDLIAESGGRIQTLLVDVRDQDSISRAAETLLSATAESGLQVLVNNAGIVVSGPLEDLPVDELRKQLDVNLIGPLAMSQAMLPALRLGKGRIIQIGSISGLLTVPFLAPYSISKSGLAVLSRALRMELSPWRIPVSLVVLGNYRTPLWTKALGEPEQAAGHYVRFLDRARQLASEQEASALNVSEAVQAIGGVIDAGKPRQVYYCGRVPKILVLLSRILPDRMVDYMLKRLYRLRESIDTDVGTQKRLLRVKANRADEPAKP